MKYECVSQELRDYADGSNDDFVKALCTGIERLLPDSESPVRLNLIASCFRELLTYQLDCLAAHAAVQQCPWYVQDPTAQAATRRQRLRFAISGGLPDAALGTLGFDEPASIAELADHYKEASKYTHVRPDRINHSDDEVGDFVLAGVTALTGLREEIDYLCDNVKEHLRDAISEHALQKFLETELDELDILSTHTRVECPYVDEIDVEKIDHAYVYVNVTGDVNVELVYGSRSDFRRGDGATLNDSFPFQVSLRSPVNNLENFETTQQIKVDTSSWYE
ncbi:hypothetical protein SAMN04488020_1208 [Palleronia marisminoris]|uniref:Uncharacterized protein n=1 Tax=Palleronia marisminoris TaxID=315423 RepID=A0A1Y5TSV4_9RHOB|nr:hypothetical protein [Palleronia marisminoris]SFH52482.1 hypothetical protein SAMN04488020_1208 [Palleronia marisminoris]SLN71575.1 hypothetical protein PAM7066_03668 [Palleronia marisminoris]